MTPEIHHAALRAAARLALSAAVPAFVFACGGAEAPVDPSTSPVASDDTSAQGSTATTEDELRANAPKTVRSYCTARHPHETTESCCRAEVRTATFPSDPTWNAGPDLRVDAITRGCCDLLAGASSKLGKPFPERAQCCPAIGWETAVACTPWGPPVPPKMSPVTFALVA
jgi:hypothetical protein